MHIFNIEIENFRILKDFEINLEEELSLIVGKNNSGKTSILAALDKFLNQSERNRFSYYDFNIEFKHDFDNWIRSTDTISEEDYEPLGIKLKLFIEYFENDNLANISRVMMDLDPENNKVVLGFEYIISYSDYKRLRSDYQIFENKETAKFEENDQYKIKSLTDFLNNRHSDYFKSKKYSFGYNKETDEAELNNYIDLDSEKISIKEILNFKYISAKRDVTNKEVDKTLSGQTSRIYRRTEASEEENNTIEEFKDKLIDTDTQLSGIYSSLFNGTIEKVKKFGGIKPNDSEIEIISTLQHRELLEGNTTVVYKHDAENKLPEYNNGLGYLNLISMIFEIEILVQEFRRKKDEKPADINLLFIEEPEAHTHPQMQYVFIKNIKDLLKEGVKREDGENRDLQYIISTHSSHIVADSDFNDIKYLRKTLSNEIVSKDLMDLEEEYKDEEKNFRFLKQYLTLNRAELLFADKAIFIEGDTERILLPAMMKKIDQEYKDNPLLSQNISIVEVGAHSHIFEKFIDFIGIEKSIIITDIDSYYLKPELDDKGVQKEYKNGKLRFVVEPCAASHKDARSTSNNSLKFFHNAPEDLKYFKELKFDKKILSKNGDEKWHADPKGNLLVLYQIEESGYHARSFEDAFFHINKDFITHEKNIFSSLRPTHLESFKNDTIDVFDFSEKAVIKKPALAIEILLNSETDKNDIEFSNWSIPAYIKEGLVWLKQD
ncbi:AAA family ATPase [Labilibaculum sp. A4]|uniref:ATP-dependent nuclease n=1 Tax=Labilibaculum euxinus TaxID=2686357 RepID=UPI000F61B9F6|nr:ATP-dependent endonuclease [Labilibaculum euxinus]MDQ1771017.1 ATP-dependent endonuclease [Labilibaculum euxinus]MWN76972.1 AAA family ATPase [Labilibaculum euxinus]